MGFASSFVTGNVVTTRFEVVLGSIFPRCSEHGVVWGEPNK
jgi:hypothetical protein